MNGLLLATSVGVILHSYLIELIVDYILVPVEASLPTILLLHPFD